MQTSHGALGVCVNKKLLDKRGNGMPFPSCISVLFGGRVGGEGGGNYVTWTRHMTIAPLK